MPYERFKLHELPVSPWKNGGGSTREILCWPPGADMHGFDWRVSVASIAAPGPFSPFPGVDRTIVLLEGDGVWLEGEGVRHRLDVLHDPFAFSGDLALRCQLLGGPSTDFNVMARREGGSATVSVFSEAHVMPRCTYGLLLSVQGHYHLRGAGLLKTWDGLWWAEQPQEWMLTPASRDARLIAVRWEPRIPE